MTDYLRIGFAGAGNTLAIRDGGKVSSSASGSVGFNTGASNNIVLVTGSGSVWQINLGLSVGESGVGNSLVISNGGSVVSSNASMGVNAGGRGVLTLAGGSLRVNSGVTLGNLACTATGIVNVVGGDLFATNATASATIEVRSGIFLLNFGTVIGDKLVITNACAQFVRTGGTLIVGTLVLDPALDADGDGLPNGWEQTYGLDPLSTNGVDGANGDPDGDGMTNLQEFQAGSNPVADIKSIAREGDDVRVTWTAAQSKTNALQSAAGDGGSYTNNFTDTFTVTNMVVSPTNFLDVNASSASGC